MTRLIRRPLVDALDAYGFRPVLILEGARGVGKTTAVRAQLVPRGYSYATLADAATLALAAQDVAGWVERLARPAVIDEAQLLPGLPLAVKEAADRAGPGVGIGQEAGLGVGAGPGAAAGAGPGVGIGQETGLGVGIGANQFVLTGSASIGRQGLGGADPLTRRAQRFTMLPLTVREMEGRERSLAEALFEAEPIAATSQNEPNDTELVALLARGGLPAYALAEPPLSPSQLSLAVRADTLGLLSETMLPGEALNSITARSILGEMARCPGGIVNLSKAGAALHLDQRTVARYLGLLERLFLVWWLPNLATEPGRQSAARSKVHPVDTSISVESLGRAGAAPAESPQVFGPLIESHVANQVRAAASWAAEPPDLFYWRQAGNRPAEVDLVLRDPRGRLVGIEVKNTTRVGPDDLRGLRSLARDRSIHRSFLVYRGTQTLQVDRSTWAVPLRAFVCGDWFAS
ncbi:MAG: DUF4143 domain-containing protein [Bifidobacteriaceae bacterium]|jgi:predicted AAA+ superfamily ATPase|nr:DUF4143 domain-containing protein [Bifidobacteriaceae bacterium]